MVHSRATRAARSEACGQLETPKRCVAARSLRYAMETVCRLLEGRVTGGRPVQDRVAVRRPVDDRVTRGRPVQDRVARGRTAGR